MKTINKELYYGTIGDFSTKQIAEFKSAGFIKGNRVIIPKGTKILNIRRYGGAEEYELQYKNNQIIRIDLVIE